MSFSPLRRWRRTRRLRQPLLAPAEFETLVKGWRLTAQRDSTSVSRLHQLTTLLVEEKDFIGKAGVEPDIHIKLAIALQIALPIAELGIESLDRWHTILIYPGAFRARHRNYRDRHGVVHRDNALMEGEAWLQGGLVLSLEDVLEDLAAKDDRNVVIHETAHKLDMRNGAANGFPPLPRTIRRRHWTETFAAAFERLSHGDLRGIDPYATTNPAECFAVFSETYFTNPQHLRTAFPAVFDCLRRFYTRNVSKSR